MDLFVTTIGRIPIDKKTKKPKSIIYYNTIIEYFFFFLYIVYLLK